jgi:hypothetical protein
MKIHSLQFIEAIFVNGSTSSHIRLADNNQCPVSDIVFTEDKNFIILTPKRFVDAPETFPKVMVHMSNIKYIAIVEEEETAKKKK